jgi:hypothetical protein
VYGQITNSILASDLHVVVFSVTCISWYGAVMKQIYLLHPSLRAVLQAFVVHCESE